MEKPGGEFARVIADVRSGYDIVPFFDRNVSVEAIHLTPLPEELLALLRLQPDFQEMSPGAKPRSVQITGDYGSTSCVLLYRSLGREYHIIAPTE